MQKYLFLSLFLLVYISANAQISGSGQFIIHRHLKVVGKETYQMSTGSDGTKTYAIDCFYSDRGKDVPLKTTMVLSALGEPVKMTSKGYTSRMSQIDHSVTISNDSLIITKDATTTLFAKPVNTFPVDGYAPATMHQLLINWWVRKGKPPRVNGSHGLVEIKYFGADTISISGGYKVLSAIGVKNVVWGWEFLWVDEQGDLVALITINAEGDKIEFIRFDHEDQLRYFAARSAVYGTRQYSAPPKVNRSAAIIHGVLVDVEKGTELQDATIVIKNGKISWLGPGSKAAIPAGATIIDAKGKRMLPGLWDMHAHLKQVEWGPAYMAAGITTVRDMANEFDFINSLKSNVDAGNGIGPNILRAGIIDGPGALANGIMIAETPEQGIALVRKYKLAGFNQVKLYGSLEPDVIKAVCDEAHREGITVAGHIPKSVTTMQAVDLGIDMISHISYIMRAFEADSNFVVDMDKPGNKAILQKLLDKKIVVDPTLAIFEIIYHPLDQLVSNFEPGFSMIPAELQGDIASIGLSPAEAIKKVAVLKGYQDLTSKLHKAGVPMVAGTDMIIPGYSLYRELELYVAAGFTPLAALRSATLTPAKVMGLSLKTGSLTKGKDADIILVNGNPLTNISDIRKVSLVIKAGKIYDPDELHQMIGFGLPAVK